MSRVNQISRQPQPTPVLRACDQCQKKAAPGRTFSFNSGSSSRPASSGEVASADTIKCLTCALKHRPMLKRSLIAALVVGTVLTALNQGDTLLFGQWNDSLYWKIPLTYCVPFIVATYGALTNSRK